MSKMGMGKLIALLLTGCCTGAINRSAVVSRHTVRFSHSSAPDLNSTRWNALTVGNGQFAFTADLTGLQSLNNSYVNPIAYPLNTMSNWGWHTPHPSSINCNATIFNPDGSLHYNYTRVPIVSADTRAGKGNRTVPYQFDCETHNTPCICDFLHKFPSRVHLGQLKFVLPGAEPGPGQPAGLFHGLQLEQVVSGVQSLDMYRGVLESGWAYNSSGEVFHVQTTTVVDSDTDTVSVEYSAPARMGLSVQLAFCGVSGSGGPCSWEAYNPGHPGTPLTDHQTTVLASTNSSARSARLDLYRTNLHDTYSVSCAFTVLSGDARLQMTRTAQHAFAASVIPTEGAVGNATVQASCRFLPNCCVGPGPPTAPSTLSKQPVPSFTASSQRSASSFEQFWEQGAFLSINSADPRAVEIERRVVLSLFLLRAQESGSIPPQESGLMYNSWTGKHHSEMRYWHETWKALWNRSQLLAKSDQWFIDRLPVARQHAAHQGYRGCRWGKMLGESNPLGVGRAANGSSGLMYWESPNNINPGLVWHQPHVVYMAELEYRAAPNASAKAQVLARLEEVVLCTAEFIADFPERRLGTGTNGKYLDLGPPLVSASEGEGPYDVFNPTYELTQFNMSLDIAQQWLLRLGRSRNPQWDQVRHNLAPLPVVHIRGPNQTSVPVYNRHQNCLPSVFSAHPEHCSGTNSHPALTGALGCLPLGYGQDAAIMNNTLFETLKVWDWEQAWGWDQPMVAMTATRLGLPWTAISTLLMNVSTNAYLASGYNHPSSSSAYINAYLPGNGGTLIAVALMAGGWEGASYMPAPGFPPEWDVQAEGFVPYF